MKKAHKFTPRIRFAPVIAALKVGKQVYFPGAKPGSIKTIASRIGARHNRVYYTQAEERGVIVYRES